MSDHKDPDESPDGAPSMAELTQREPVDELALPPIPVSAILSPVRVQVLPRRGRTAFNSEQVAAQEVRQLLPKSFTRARALITPQTSDLWLSNDAAPLTDKSRTPSAGAALWPSGTTFEYAGTDPLYVRSETAQYLSVIIEHVED